jgi:hypothetical protein
MDDTNDDALLPARKTEQRYDIADRTLDRWLADERLGFPRPVIINRRRYFRIRELQEWERHRAARASF